MIAIKGMTMPKSCADCQMSYLSGWVVVYCHCILGVFGVSDIDWNHERHENCPLIELDRRLRHEIYAYQDELEKKKYEID